MQKRYKNKLLGIHVHTNIPPAESANHGTARQQNQSALQTHLPSMHITKHSMTDFTRTGTPGTHARAHTHTHTHTHIHTQPVSMIMFISRFAHLYDI
jgi:hypothetical protein